MRRRPCVCAWVVVCVLMLGFAVGGAAQVNTATLSGIVTDPQGLPVHGAKVTVVNGVTGAERATVADDNGRYNLVGLPPGQYKLTVDGGANFATFENNAIVVAVGENAAFSPRLELRGLQQTVTVTTETAAIETTKTEVSQVVDERRIDNLPINGRNYINFTLTNSQTTRDVAPTIGPAPNSGLNVGGSRARSNMVSVDGADAVDNSINGIRATVSQEAVQEFQLILSNYNAEYGRATGGVVNIVTKSGGNQVHGDVFGYLRNKAFQARNSFSGQVDPATGNLDAVKQAYTRVQTGLTFGGPIKKDKTFYFFSYEYTQREETGFSSIGNGSFGMTVGQVPCIPIPLSLTSGANGQLAFYQGTLGALTGNGAACSNPNPLINGEIQGLSQAALATGAASNVALNGDLNVNANGSAVPLSTVLGIPSALGSKFFPGTVNCPLGTQVNSVVCLPVGALVASGVGTGLVPLPASYVGLNSLRGNFPVTEKTSLWSARFDQRWDNRNSSFLRIGVSPSLVTGIEPTSQNQVFGQNAGSRTGLNQVRDLGVVFQHDTIFSDSAFNEFRMQVARRGLHFGFSQLPGGDQIGVNIPGYAYFGREPYSPVDRIERRFEFTDHVSLIHGKHSFKIGGDGNVIQLRSSKTQIFQLDFGGDVNFGTLNPFGAGVPGTTGLQSYGLGVPITYIQGIGSSSSPFDNLPFAFFFQDSWRATRKLTVNYGVRYDVEVSPLFAPATAVNAAAEQALGVVEGIPRNNKNIAPRFGIAWDPAGNGKTVIRAGYGLFYDHPLLAVAFDSATADGGRSVQLSAIGGVPSACGLTPQATVCGNGLDLPTNLNGASIFQGALNALPNMGYLPNQQRFDPFFQNSLFANQNYLTAGFPLSILPFTLPVDKNFKYGYAQQANLTIEREIAGSWKISGAYQWTRGMHLNRSVDITSTDPQLLATNDGNALATGLINPGTNPLTVVVPGLSQINATCPGGIPAYNVPTANSAGSQGSIAFATPTGQPLAPGILGLAYTGPSCSGTPVGLVGTPAVFNFFRSSGPNPSFAGLVPGGYTTLLGLAQVAGFPLGPKNSAGQFVPIPFNFVDAQKSIGSSFYNALTVNVTKRFSKGFELLSSYTWSHSVDDSTDLQSTLDPADPRFPQFERSNSVNDQRHRWVSSAVFQTAGASGGEGLLRHLIGDITIAPIVELASGRPFNVITGEDTRLDLAASQARPSVAAGGAAGTASPYIPGVSFVVAATCLTNSGSSFSVPGVTNAGFGCDGNLGRNRFTTPGFFEWDMRVGKRIAIGEHMKVDVLADVFNLFNRTNIASVNQLCDPAAGSTCTAGQPTAAYDARQFQFALKLIW